MHLHGKVSAGWFPPQIRNSSDGCGDSHRRKRLNVGWWKRHWKGVAFHFCILLNSQRREIEKKNISLRLLVGGMWCEGERAAALRNINLWLSALSDPTHSGRTKHTASQPVALYTHTQTHTPVEATITSTYCVDLLWSASKYVSDRSWSMCDLHSLITFTAFAEFSAVKGCKWKESLSYKFFN